IPDSVTSIGEYAFYGCIGLKSLRIGNSVEYMSATMKRLPFFGTNAVRMSWESVSGMSSYSISSASLSPHFTNALASSKSGR
ncbi:MAG: leucine-rich repeat protein, partial [Clostridia bacterium]|nr:leucine-rich repeat protein [Clostridia bacterium]